MEFLDTYFKLQESVDQITNPDQLRSFVDELLRSYGLQHAVYYLPGKTGPQPVSPFHLLTYKEQWINRYIEADYLAVDPVVSQGFAGLLPIDWQTLERNSPRVRALFAESVECGVGRQGLTFPIRGRYGEAALFSVTSDLPDKEWRDAKRTYVRDLQILAHTIHAKAMLISGRSIPNYDGRLTPRERECLTWCAVGKTGDDIAAILGISEGVVRIHLQSAQHKLNCLNRTHTVAKAMAHNLIFPDIR